MRLDEIVSLNTVLKSDQYLKILRNLKMKSIENINIQKLKNKIIQSWKKGIKQRKHYDSLLSEIDTNIDNILQEEN